MLIALVVLQSLSLVNTIKLLRQPNGEDKPSEDEPPALDEQPSEPIDFSGKKLTFLGDSITYGVDGMGGQHMMSYPLPVLVQKELGAKTAINLGISGSTLCTAPDSLGTTYDHHPFVNRVNTIPSDSDIVCVFGGVNDYALGLPLGAIEDENGDTVYGALNGIMTQIKTRCPNAFVFLMTPFGLGQWKLDASPADYELTDVVTAIKLIGEKFNAPVLDLYNDSGWRQTEMLDSNSDGIHPSQYFMSRHIAPMIADFIREEY